jgi:hypothetical protein
LPDVVPIRQATTLLNEQQAWHPDAIERQLAHALENKVRAAYNYAEHPPERRRMLQAQADYRSNRQRALELARMNAANRPTTRAVKLVQAIELNAG